MTTESQICEICSQPKSTGLTGSFTQWVSACRCAQSESGQLAIICVICGKQVDKGNTGSFTQWVLQSEICNCENPILLDPNLSTSHVLSEIVDNAQGVGKTLEEELNELNAETFPLDRYQPVEKLGVGGTGSVYLCFDKHLQKNVAVKIASAKLNDERENFQTEAKVTAKFKHPNIVSIIDFGLTPSGAPFMVLEHVNGVSLDKYIREKGPLEERVAIPLFIQIASAMEKGHESGIFHRDIKSSNIIITHEGKKGDAFARIIDFGIAMTGHQTTEFHGKNVTGTPKYMSPDQLLGRAFDARSEIYSFGCVMYETLTGSLPFKGDALTLLDMHTTVMPPTFEEIAPDVTVTPALERIVLRCLEKDPDLRFQTVTDLMIALHRANRDETFGSSSTFQLIDNSMVPNDSTNSGKVRGMLLDNGSGSREASGDIKRSAGQDKVDRDGKQISNTLPALVVGTILILSILAFSTHSFKKKSDQPGGKKNTTQSKPNKFDALLPVATDSTVDGDEFTGKGREVSEAFEKSMALNPKDSFVCYQAALHYGRVEQWKHALRAIERAIKIEPKTDYYQYRADIYLHLGEDARAVAECEGAIKSGTREVRLYRTYGAALITQHKYKEAEHAFTVALTIDPKHTAARVLRAALYEKMKQDQKAIDDYTAVLKYIPHDTTCLQRRATLYDRRGEHELAAKDRAALPEDYSNLFDGINNWTKH